jgi:hypothetical protein
MTGLTEEIASVSEALDKLYQFSVETYGRAPTHFIVGLHESRRLVDELAVLDGSASEVRLLRSYRSIPLVISQRSGVDAGLPLALAG